MAKSRVAAAIENFGVTVARRLGLIKNVSHLDPHGYGNPIFRATRDVRPVKRAQGKRPN